MSMNVHIFITNLAINIQSWKHRLD